MKKKPAIMGWALTSSRALERHALPRPIDLGFFGRAACGKYPNLTSGWVEPHKSTPPKFCRDCLKVVEAA